MNKNLFQQHLILINQNSNFQLSLYIFLYLIIYLKYCFFIKQIRFKIRFQKNKTFHHKNNNNLIS